MSKIIYNTPIQSTSGKIFGKNQNISQRKLFGIYETTYCYRNKPEHWSDAQTLHRRKMGAASLYAKLLLQDPDFAAQATAYRLDLIRRAQKPHSTTGKKLRIYLRNQQMITSLLYNRLSAATSANASNSTSALAPSLDASLAATLLDGYARYAAAHAINRHAVLAQLAAELNAPSFQAQPASTSPIEPSLSSQVQPSLSATLKSIIFTA